MFGSLLPMMTPDRKSEVRDRDVHASFKKCVQTSTRSILPVVTSVGHDIHEGLHYHC